MPNKPEAKNAKSAKTASGGKGKTTKGKKGSKKTGASRIAVVLDGVPATEMSKEQLLVHVGRLVDCLEAERQERNLLQIERDQIYTFWQVAKDNTEDLKAQLKIKQKEVEDCEELRQSDIEIYKQRIKYLLYEHQCALSDAKAEHHAALELGNQQREADLQNLRQDHQKTKERLRQCEAEYNIAVQQLREQHSQELSSLRNRLETDLKQVEDKHRKKLETASSERDSRRKTEIQELESNFKQQIKELKENHEKSLIQMKNYYNDIVLNNMTLITALKEQVTELRTKEERLEKQLSSAANEAKRLRTACDKYESENKSMKKESEQWNKTKESLQHAKSHQKSLSQQLEQRDWTQEVTEQALERLKKERDDLEEKFLAAILEIQQKANFKQMVLEKKLKILEATLEQKDQEISRLSNSQSRSMKHDDSFNSSGSQQDKKKTIVKLPANESTISKGRDFSEANLSKSSSIEENLSFSAQDFSKSAEISQSRVSVPKFQSAQQTKFSRANPKRQSSSAK